MWKVELCVNAIISTYDIAYIPDEVFIWVFSPFTNSMLLSLYWSQFTILSSNNSLHDNEQYCCYECYDLAKWLSHYLYFFFFYLGLTTQKRVWESIMSHVTGSYSITWHDGSHDRHGKVVHRPCSSCISSIENLMGTLLSSLCQLLNKEQLT